ncbi:MAG TPA: hypothetical protein PLM24_03890 [Methanothrix sp.]|nr:hypothetical protein [Methanothrix sp.]HPR66257.1 hypothetical protein [Methanothrix sp.]
MIPALLLAASYPTPADGSPEDEWLGIGGLRIVDVHHTEGYILGMMNLTGENGTGWIEPGLPAGTSAYVVGIWTFYLAGEETRRLDLALYQVEDEIFGEGTMTSASGTTLATAAGYATSSLLDLHVVTVGDLALYRLRLGLLTSPIQGSYAAYSASGLAGYGAVSGYKTAPLGEYPGPAETEEVSPPDLTGSFGAGLGAV